MELQAECKISGQGAFVGPWPGVVDPCGNLPGIVRSLLSWVDSLPNGVLLLLSGKYKHLHATFSADCRRKWRNETKRNETKPNQTKRNKRITLGLHLHVHWHEFTAVFCLVLAVIQPSVW